MKVKLWFTAQISLPPCQDNLVVFLLIFTKLTKQWGRENESVILKKKNTSTNSLRDGRRQVNLGSEINLDGFTPSPEAFISAADEWLLIYLCFSFHCSSAVSVSASSLSVHPCLHSQQGNRKKKSKKRRRRADSACCSLLLAVLTFVTIHLYAVRVSRGATVPTHCCSAATSPSKTTPLPSSIGYHDNVFWLLRRVMGCGGGTECLNWTLSCLPVASGWGLDEGNSLITTTNSYSPLSRLFLPLLFAFAFIF